MDYLFFPYGSMRSVQLWLLDDLDGCLRAMICFRGALMDDAMIISCGHSVGNAGRRRVMETVRVIFISSTPILYFLVVCLHSVMNMRTGV